MAFNTKLRLADAKFWQDTGDDLNLSGTTKVGTAEYLTDASGSYGVRSIPDVAYVTGQTADLQADIDYISGETSANDADIAYISGETSTNTTDIATITGLAITGATNGLTKSGQDAKLGGTLSENVSLFMDGNRFAVQGASPTQNFIVCPDNARMSYGTVCSTVFQVDSGGTCIQHIHGSDRATLSLAGGNGNIITCSTGAIWTTACDLVLFDCSGVGMKYNVDYSANYVDRSLVDKAYVDSATGGIGGANGLSRISDNIVLGGALTGDTSITGSYLLAANVTTLNLTGVTTNLGGTIYIKSDPAGTGGLLCRASDGQVCETSLAAFGGITGGTNGLTDCGSQELGFGGTLCANTTINGGYSLTFGDLQNICLSTSGTTDIALNAKSNGGIAIKSQSGTVATSTDFTNAVGILADFNAASGLAIYDNRATATGIIYAADYATNYVDRSLVDKGYVDSVAAGLDPKSAVLVATTANITLSGTQTIDGVSLVAGDRILVKDQTSGETNGIYVVTGGTWSRATDFDGTPVGEVTEGALIPVLSGGTNINSSWILITKDPITIGTTVLEFTKFSQLLDVAAGAGIAISTVGETNTICVNLGSNSGLNTSSGLVVDSSIGGVGLTLTNGVLNVNAENCGSVGAIPVGYNTGDCLVVACSDITSALGTPINSASNGLTKLGSNVVLGGALTGATTISSAGATSLTFTDTRATQVGIKYGGDYTSTFDNCSLITKEYADDCNAAVSAATFVCSSSYADACDAVVSAATYQCSSDYTDACVGACTITANNGLTKSGANNITLGGNLTGDTVISGDTYDFTIQDNGQLFSMTQNPAGTTRTNKFDSIVGDYCANICGIVVANTSATASLGAGNLDCHSDVFLNQSSIQIGYNDLGGDSDICITTGAMTITDTINSKGIVYAGDYTGNFDNCSLVTKAYVDAEITGGTGAIGGANGLSRISDNIVLGGALTGNTSLTGAYDLGFTHTNFNITAAVCVTGAIDTSSTLGVGGVLTLDSVASGSVSTDTILVRDSGGVIKEVDADTLGEDNNRYSIDVVTGNTTLPTSGYTILVSGATSVTLPTGVNGMAYKIKDACGNALASPITVVGTIDGAANASINTDYGALELAYSSTLVEWYSLAFIN